jgi:hypothetical protein
MKRNHHNNNDGCELNTNQTQPPTEGRDSRVEDDTAHQMIPSSDDRYDERYNAASGDETIDHSSPPSTVEATPSTPSSCVVPGAVPVRGGHDVGASNNEKWESHVPNGQAMKNHDGRFPPTTQPGAVAVAGIMGAARRGETDIFECDEAHSDTDDHRKDGTIVDGTSQKGEGGSLAMEWTKSATIAADMPTPDHKDDGTILCYNDDTEEQINASCSVPAENDNLPSAVPSIQAELVLPPVEAFRVSIDEDPQSGLTPLEMEYRQSKGDEEGNRDCYTILRSNKWTIMLVFVVSIICAITIPFIVVDSDQVNSEVQQTPTLAPTYPYICYTSTLDILRLQVYEESIPEAFVICPNTVIEIGTFRDPATNDFHFVDGDYPLTAIRHDVLIQCGLDGRQENNCIIDGGFLQVLTQQYMPPIAEGEFVKDSSIDNFILRGLTFTGKPESSGPFRGSSIVMSMPGKNIRFENCLWSNFSAQGGLIAIGQNPFQDIKGQELEKNVVDVTFVNCVFENILYDNPLIIADGQNITIEQSVFRNIQLSALVDLDCASVDLGFVWDDGSYVEVNYDTGCAILLYCGIDSVCILRDLCVYDFAFQAVSLVHSTNWSQLVHENLFLDVAASEEEDPAAEDDNDDVCQLTELSIVEDSPIVSDCIDIFLSATCSLTVS